MLTLATEKFQGFLKYFLTILIKSNFTEQFMSMIVKTGRKLQFFNLDAFSDKCMFQKKLFNNRYNISIIILISVRICLE